MIDYTLPPSLKNSYPSSGGRTYAEMTRPQAARIVMAALNVQRYHE